VNAKGKSAGLFSEQAYRYPKVPRKNFGQLRTRRFFHGFIENLDRLPLKSLWAIRMRLGFSISALPGLGAATGIKLTHYDSRVSDVSQNLAKVFLSGQLANRPRVFSNTDPKS